MAISVTQLDKLGVRLRDGQLSDDDLRLLNDYRRSFEDASSAVFTALRLEFGLAPTARPAKSTTAIIDKLRRQQTRLTRIQDIAGCRVIVASLAAQNDLTGRLKAKYADARQIDRVESPSHGYCAQHLVVKVADRVVETQVRTELQHLWAALSEKVADRYGHGIKYGCGDAELLGRLLLLSDQVHEVEVNQDGVDFLTDSVLRRGNATLTKDFQDQARSYDEDRRILRASLQQLVDSPDTLVSQP